MDHEGYTGRSTEERWGCIASTLIGTPIFLFLLVADAIGDCAPGTSCQKGFLTQVLLPSFTIAALVGLMVWWAIKVARRRGR